MKIKNVLNHHLVLFLDGWNYLDVPARKLGSLVIGSMGYHLLLTSYKWNFLLNYGGSIPSQCHVSFFRDVFPALDDVPTGRSLPPGQRTHLQAPHGPARGGMDRLGLGGGQAGFPMAETRKTTCFGMSQAGKLGFQWWADQWVMYFYNL